MAILESLSHLSHNDALSYLSPLQDPKTLTLTLLTLFLAHRLTLLTYRLLFHPLRSFPGPLLAKLTSTYQAYYDIILDGAFVTHCHNILHPRYGPIVRIGPNRLRINSVDAFHQINKIGTRFSRDEDTYLMFGFENIMSEPDNERHRQRRSLFQKAFQRSQILKAEGLVGGKMRRFRKKLDEMCVESGGVKEINVLTAVNCQGLEIFTEFAFAQNSKYLDTPDFNDQFAAGMHDILDATAWTKNFPRFFVDFRTAIPQWLRSIIFPKSGIQNVMMAHSRSIIESYRTSFYKNTKLEKLEGRFKPHTFLDTIFAEQTEEETPSDTFYRDVHMIFAASFGTIGYTTLSGLYFIQSNPDVYKRVIEELYTVQPRGKRDGFIDYATILNKLPYFCAVVRETLRLSLTVCGGYPRVTPPEGANINLPTGPVHLPGNSIVEVTVYSAHMDPETFPNPEKFDPERWMDKAEAARLDRHIIAFGGGGRICLGMHMGLMQVLLSIKITCSTHQTVIAVFSPRFSLNKNNNLVLQQVMSPECIAPHI